MKHVTKTAKHLLTGLLLAAALVILPGMSARAQADDMGIIRLNFTLSGSVLTGSKMDAFLYTMGKMSELGMLRRSPSYQSFDLDMDGNDDIAYDAMTSATGGMIRLYALASPGLQTKVLTVPDSVKQQAASEDHNWCDKIYLTLYGEPTRLLSIGATEGGGFFVNGNDYDDSLNMTLEQDEVVTLCCAPDKNYKFAGWYEGIVSMSYFVSGHTGELISDEDELTINSKSNVDICAVYVRDVCPNGGDHSWTTTAHKATLTENGGVYMRCSKCGKEEYVTPLAAVNQISLERTSYDYDGKEKKPKVTVKNGFGDVLGEDQYKVEYSDNIKPGTAKAKVTLTSDWYEGTKTLTFTIKGNAKVNTMSVKAKTVKLALKKVKQKKQVVTAKKAMTVKNAKGKVTYKLVSVAKSKFGRNFSINEKTGKITVKKGTKKGTYTLKIKVKTAGDAAYLPAEKTVKVKIKIS